MANKRTVRPSTSDESHIRELWANSERLRVKFWAHLYETVLLSM